MSPVNYSLVGEAGYKQTNRQLNVKWCKEGGHGVQNVELGAGGNLLFIPGLGECLSENVS